MLTLKAGTLTSPFSSVSGPPQCERLVIRGEAIEGEILSFVATYRGGVMGTSVAEWTRVEQNGGETVVSNQGEDRKADITCLRGQSQDFFKRPRLQLLRLLVLLQVCCRSRSLETPTGG